MINEIDREILRILQDNARTSNAEIARQVDMAPSAIAERIRKLEERGVIRGYCAQIDPESIGLGVTAFVFVRSNERGGAQTTSTQLAELPEVQEIHHVAGEDCFLLKVRLPSTRALGSMLSDRFGPIESIVSTRSTIVMDTVKETPRLPIPAPIEEESNG